MNALILHPTIYLDASGTSTDALLVRDGLVIAHGDAARNMYSSIDTPSLTPEGACLFPALADAHIHLWGLGQRIGLLDLRDTESPEEILSRLATHDASLTASGWIEGHGWDHNSWSESDAPLTREMLDRVAPEVPVCLYRVDHHAAIVNSAALRRAHVTSDILDPPGGRFDRDASGDLTGLLVDQAIERVTRHIPEESDEEILAIYTDRAMMLRAFGITSAHMAWSSVRAANLLRALHERATLPIRTFCMVNDRDPALESLLAMGPLHDPLAELSISCIKFFADGAMGSRGALMKTPYRDGSTGLSVTERETLIARIPPLLESGWQVAVHAIGDLAAKHVLDAFEHASPASRMTMRPRHEHAQIVADEDFERFADLDAIASVQPIHYYSDVPWADRVLHPEQLARLYAWARLLPHTTLAAGSDFPIDDPNPWRGIATFSTRNARRGEPLHPEHAISRKAALHAYTEGAAFAARWEDRLGHLRRGACADFIALPIDPFTATPEQLWDMQVLDTFTSLDPVNWP